MSRILKLGIFLLIMLLGLAFHLRNNSFVTVDFYAGSADLPLSLWMFIALAAGACLGILAALPALVRLRRDRTRLLRRLEAGDRERRDTRAAPGIERE